MRTQKHEADNALVFRAKGRSCITPDFSEPQAVDPDPKAMKKVKMKMKKK